MKFNTEKIKEKLMWFKTKMGRKTLIVCVSVLVVGLAVTLNFVLFNNSSKPKDEGNGPQIDLSNVSGQIEKNDSKENYEYFATMQLTRQQARDEAIEVLQSVVDNENSVADMKTEAMAEIEKIAQDIAKEANIETLIAAKGFEDCVAVISGNTASVVIKSEGLQANELSQIYEIVYEQAGILPSNLNIIEK